MEGIFFRMKGRRRQDGDTLVTFGVPGGGGAERGARGGRQHSVKPATAAPHGDNVLRAFPESNSEKLW